MAKLSLTPPETFFLSVPLPVPGQASVPVRFQFRYRDRESLKAFKAKVFDVPVEEAITDEQALADILAGWDLDDDFTPDNIARLCAAYPSAGFVIVGAYLNEQLGIRKA